MFRKKLFLIFITLFGVLCVSYPAIAQPHKEFPWNKLPVKALLLSAPTPGEVQVLSDFIRDALPREGVSTLALRIEYLYQFKSHPELAEKNALSESDLKKFVKACKDAHIRFIPTVNLLAHQSEKTEIGPLLKQYPQFDESPDYNPPVPWKDGGQWHTGRFFFNPGRADAGRV